MSPRKAHVAREFYETPPGFTRALLRELVGRGLITRDASILEPAAGDGAIVRVLHESGFENVFTNDNDPARDTLLHEDARELDLWDAISPVDAVIMNPPFSDAYPILAHALRVAKLVAMHVRITWEEPSVEREQFLVHGPQWHGRIVLPRYKFNPDSKSSDSATTVWLIYVRGAEGQWSIVAPRSVRDETF